MVEQFAVVRRGHELGRRALAHGHVGEDPGEERPFVDEPVEVRVGGHGVRVVVGVADGHAEGQPVAREKIHGRVHLGVGARAAPPVGGRFVALGGDGRHEVLHADHLLAELLVDERGVREAQKRAVRMGLAQPNEIALAHEGLAASIDVHVHAEFLALADDGVDLVVGEVQGVPVLGGPAAGAVEVAGARRIQQDGPGDVALMALAHLLLLAPGEEVRVHDEGLQQIGPHLGVQVHDAHDELVHIRLVLDGVREGGALLGEQAGRSEGVDFAHDVRHVVLGVVAQIIDELVGQRLLRSLGGFHGLLLCTGFLWHSVIVAKLHSVSVRVMIAVTALIACRF